LVTVVDGVMASYSAGGISSAEAGELIAALRTGLGIVPQDGSGASTDVGGSEAGRLGLFAGVGFRHILTVRDGADLLATNFAASHDVTDRPVADFLPSGPGAGLIQDLMERSKAILAGHPVNKARIARGDPPATQIWLFWPGMRPAGMPSFSDIYGGMTAAMTSGVDLLRGLAIQTGVDRLVIHGVTDGADNDFEGQMAGALEALREHDLVFVHVEAPDEASHSGDVEGKVRAIEQVDALMVPQVLALNQGAGGDGVRMLVLPDHPTPLAKKSHVAEPVPFVLWGPGIEANGAEAFNEAEARATGFAVAPGHLLMSMLLAAPSAGASTESHLPR
jgi:2,3-bisphosphoglycerate-independent phosphoglycerate mutase